MTYTHNDVYTATLNYFNDDAIATNVWMTKYALRSDVDSADNFIELTPDDMHIRLSREFARVESKFKNSMSFDEIKELFDHFKYVIPQGSPMAAIGNEKQLQSLSNCFVIAPPFDSYGGILLTDQEEAQIMKRRGGVGFDISTIRPAGLLTDNAARTTDGIGVFMTRYSNTCREVAQGGRRGALMITLNCHHPQVRTFVNIKRDLTKVTGANISLQISDEFMRAVAEGTDVQLRWPVEPNVPHVIEQMVSARDLWHDIVSAARDCSEPGLLFWDTVQRMTPADAYEEFKSISTNPCAELNMSAYDSCRLMVINVTSFVHNEFSPIAYFDFEAFGVVVNKAQRLMDDLVDMEIEIIDKIISKIENSADPQHIKRTEFELWNKIKQSAINGRRTGLGVTGVGDAIAMLNHRYGDVASIEFVEQLYKTLACQSYISSIEMARDRGHFPVWNFEQDMTNEFLQRIYNALPTNIQTAWRQYGRRNIANTTTAPCGSVSVCTQTTSGIEPAIFLKYMRKKKVNDNDPGTQVDSVDELGDKWMHFNIVHHGLLRWMNMFMSQTAIDTWIGSSDTTTDFSGVEASPYWNATAAEINVADKVKIQAAAQKWLCHGVSNTANLPNDVTVETVSELYRTAHELGCKGVTIYREGSRDAVMVSSSNQSVTHQHQKSDGILDERPDSLLCDVHDVKVKGEQWMIFVGLIDGRPYEVFGGKPDDIRLGKVKSSRIVKRKLKKGQKYDLYYTTQKSTDENVIRDIVGTFDDPDMGAFTRLLSLALRHGAPIAQLIKQLQKDRDADLSSFARVVARVLKRYVKDGTSVGQACTSCGADSLFYQEGCVTCGSCGVSVCG